MALLSVEVSRRHLSGAFCMVRTPTAGFLLPVAYPPNPTAPHLVSSVVKGVSRYTPQGREFAASHCIPMKTERARPVTHGTSGALSPRWLQEF
jgi:hypothetical protein